MLPSILAAVLAATTLRAAPPVCIAIEPECPRVSCSMECWAVHVRLVVNVAADGEPVELRTRGVLDGGLWGTQAGADCHAAKVMRSGVWIEHPQDAGRRMLVMPTDASPGQVLEGQ
jgi:hypothetical protein